MTSSTFSNADDHDSAEVERLYLLVSSDSPVEVRAAMLRAPSAPDLCVRSPSPEARRAAETAFGGGYVRTIVEPLLARRGDAESLGDFMSRCAEALRTLYAFETRTALVVFDELPAALGGALELQEHELLRIADELERAAPAAQRPVADHVREYPRARIGQSRVARRRVATSTIASGAAVAAAVAAGSSPSVAALAGQDAAAVVFLLLFWSAVAGLDASGTAMSAKAEDASPTEVPA